MQKRDEKIWKHVVGNVKGGFGETDFNKKIIKIDKKKHKMKKYANDYSKSENTLINTITHEESPKKTEVQIRKLAKNKVKKMGPKLKTKLYNKYK